MPVVVNTTSNDGYFHNASVLGINGRGKKREGRTYTAGLTGGKTATIAEDVTNQVTTAPDNK